MSQSLIYRTLSSFDYQLLIKNILFAPVAFNPEQEIVYRGEKRFTYSRFLERVHRLADALVKLGVRRGDTVAIMDWDSHRYLECFFAVPMIGAVLHTVNVRFTPEQILYTIDHAEDDVMLVNADFMPILEHIKGRMDTVKRFVLLSDEGVPPHSQIHFDGEYEALLEAASPSFDFPDFDENTRATTFYTTGTTGLPKGVYFSHRQLMLHTMGVIAAMSTPATQGRFHREDVYMPITPMFHVHAWGFPYIATMLGVKQVYPGKYVPELLLSLIAEEGVTLSHCVPTILHMLLKSPKIEEVDLSRWKVLVGGSAMSKALCAAALKRGIDVFTGYGMSETCPVLTLAHLDSSVLSMEIEAQAETRCKTGRPLPLVELKVVDDTMKEKPRDGKSEGEIVVRAPWLTQGYLKDDKNSEKLWLNGYLHTNDLAHRDKAGYVKITDRMKDVIKVGGEWVSSLELEDILSTHEDVAEVAVIGMPDEKWGERPLALVVPRPDRKETLTEKEIVRHAMSYADKGMITKQVVLAKVRMVDSIDKTSVGKINKVALRKKYQAGE